MLCKHELVFKTSKSFLTYKKTHLIFKNLASWLYCHLRRVKPKRKQYAVLTEPHTLM